MTLALWMILIAALLPYVTVGLAKGGNAGGYDNARPRAWAGRQTDWRARAIAAHQNHFEAFAPFAAAVIVARIGHADTHLTNMLAVTFVVLRVAYTVAYLQDLPGLRSTLWMGGMGCVIALFAITA